jgi:hypothetical protein
LTGPTLQIRDFPQGPDLSKAITVVCSLLASPGLDPVAEWIEAFPREVGEKFFRVHPVVFSRPHNVPLLSCGRISKRKRRNRHDRARGIEPRASGLSFRSEAGNFNSLLACASTVVDYY